MLSLVRPTSITYSSAFENADYRAANGRLRTSVSAAIVGQPEDRETASRRGLSQYGFP